jgi:hypothetical protein
LLSSTIGQNQKRTAVGSRPQEGEGAQWQAKGGENLKLTAATDFQDRRSAKGCAQGHRVDGKSEEKLKNLKGGVNASAATWCTCCTAPTTSVTPLLDTTPDEPPAVPPIENTAESDALPGE